MRRAVLVVLAGSVTALACAHEQSAPPVESKVAPISTVTSARAMQPSAPVEAAPAPRDDGRLPALATPLHYAIALDVDPAQARFHGTTSIDVDVPRPTSHVVLHGHDLAVTDVGAQFGSKAISGTSSSRVAHGGVDPEELVLDFSEPIAAGRATITIAYDAPFAGDLSGLYRVKEGERWYAFTQFEATDARRAFPCFDEPGFKATYDVSIHAPKGMLAVANTPERARTDDATGARFEFATTPPLSSYLVAFAVGDFDVREGAKDPVPIRLVTVKGKAGLGDFSLDATAGLVKKLGEYFALPYPFAKLDIVAVPDFAAGAMENPGLITFREEILLQDPKHPSLGGERSDAITIAHELAHMWFGDLVTMQWWNDVWLNEGFATWMETRVTDAWRPSFTVHTEAVADTQHVMDTDALASARAVRQPVTTNSDVAEAFDGISYEKGAAVLAMIEHWIGDDAFQRGVRDYIRAHAWKNAKADDLLGALDRASGRDVSGMAATFLDHPGVPLVSVKSACTAGKLSFDFTQTTWRPLGSEAKEDTAAWRVPVCVHDANGKRDECVDMKSDHATLESKGSCTVGSFPNAAGLGYYRFALSEREARSLARDVGRLDAASRIGLVSNLWAQVRAGDLAPDVLLDLLPSFDRETDGYVIKEVVDTLYGIDATLVDEASRAPFRAYVASRMAAHKKRLGWQAKAGEDDASTVARSEVLLLLGDLAEDATTRREADVVAKRWLADPNSVGADVAGVAVRVASMRADGARWDELRTEARTAKAPYDRITALRGLGAFEDPKQLARTFDLLLTDDVKMQDVRTLLGARLGRGVFERPDASRAFFAWLNAHWEAARAKLPGPLASSYSRVLEGACSAEERDAELAFLRPHMTGVEGAARPLAEAAERVTSCSELRSHGAASVARFFGVKSALPHQKG